jgi:translation initiation factor 2 subunit 2
MHPVVPKPLNIKRKLRNTMEYEKLLDRAMEKLPTRSEEKSRFEMPKVLGHIQGNRTIISNFYQIADAVGRPVEHVLKYILKELATPGELTKSALIIGTKTPASRVNEKISQYVRDFVMCKECDRPDTKLIKEDKMTFMKCSACGARHAVKVKV